MATAAKLASNSTSNTNAERPGPGSLSTQTATPPPLNTAPPAYKTASVPSTSLPASALNGAGNGAVPVQKSISLVQQRGSEDSPVMNETLSVIDEHITDMHMLPQSMAREDERPTINSAGNDSGSEYSSHIDHRLSYIAGHETDEEERNLHTEKEVSLWTPAQVAEHLEDIGVEYGHCETFKEQEINGEVLLAMDQASIFMKEFNLGLVGQRLRTWHKIKALQEEVRGAQTLVNNSRHASSGKVRSDGFEPPRRSATGPSASPSLVNHFETGQLYLQRATPSPQPSPPVSHQILQAQRPDATSTPSSFTFRSGMDSPGRPSAASIREFNHSRRHSAADFASINPPLTPTDPNSPSTLDHVPTTSPHKKTPSLDRNWTMGSLSPRPTGRPMSAVNAAVNAAVDTSTDRNVFDLHTPAMSLAFSGSRDIDRGYASGGEAEGKKTRNVLRKRGDTVSASHSRQSSYQDGKKRMSFAGTKRHSRFGSVDSIKDTVVAMTAPASKIYHGNGIGIKSHFRNSSANEALAQSHSTSDLTSPTVTKLEYDDRKKPSMKIITSSNNVKSGPSSSGSPKSATAPKSGGSKPRIGLRAISDAVTGNERAIAQSPPSVPSPIKESARHSPARTGSTTPSGASQSIDRESTDASSKGTSGVQTGLTPTSGTRRKTKKETSAYTRGLEMKTPHEQMIGCDYSGWMKKKSSSIMTTWKPRLFVLRGRRLSYYYSEEDTQEKGLIDISSHRVLPADSDIITGIHASVTGAKSTPVSPAAAHTPTMASKEAAAQPESTLQRPSDSTFIFKLVPPRSGLSRAVNFTKPTVHYFAVDNVRQGRLWMAALMKATIDRDETKPIKTTYQQQTISLAKARAMRHRPPALMGLDEKIEGMEEGPKSDETGLAIQGLDMGRKENSSVEHKRAGSLDATASLSTTEQSVQ